MNKWVSIFITALSTFIISAVGALGAAGATTSLPTTAQIFWACVPAAGAAALTVQKSLEAPPQ